MVEIKGKKFTVVLREEPEGGYSAQCVELLAQSVKETPAKRLLPTLKKPSRDTWKLSLKNLTSLSERESWWK